MSDVTLPNTIATGQQRSAAKIQQNDEALRDFVNGDGWIDSSKYAPGSVADDKLASPNNAMFRHLYAASGALWAGTGAGTFALVQPNPLATPTNLAADNKAFGFGVYLAAADFAVSGKQTSIRLRATVGTNGTVPTITFTFGLYPVALSGGSNQIVATFGTVVSGTTAAIASPAANSATSAVSNTVNLPANGLYALGVATNGALTTNAAVLLAAQLQINHV